MDALEGQAMSEAQKTEYLTILFNVMKCFVDIGFGVNSIPRLLPQTDSIARDTPPNKLDLTPSKHLPNFNKHACDKAVERRAYEPVPKHP